MFFSFFLLLYQQKQPRQWCDGAGQLGGAVCCRYFGRYVHFDKASYCHCVPGKKEGNKSGKLYNYHSGTHTYKNRAMKENSQKEEEQKG